MALRWLVHSACHVLGYSDETNNTKEGPRHLDYSANVNLKSSAKGTTLKKEKNGSGFEMPLHYPRYSKTDYEKMEDWKIDVLLAQYGLSFDGNLDEKRKYAMGAFLWPHQY